MKCLNRGRKLWNPQGSFSELLSKVVKTFLLFQGLLQVGWCSSHSDYAARVHCRSLWGLASNFNNKNFVYWKVSLPKMLGKMNNTLDKPNFNVFFIAEERNAPLLVLWRGQRSEQEIRNWTWTWTLLLTGQGSCTTYSDAPNKCLFYNQQNGKIMPPHRVIMMRKWIHIWKNI